RTTQDGVNIEQHTLKVIAVACVEFCELIVKPGHISKTIIDQRVIPKALEVAVWEIDLDKLVVSEPGCSEQGMNLSQWISHMHALYELLDLNSEKEVRLVGICGPGSVGKTTLGRHAYEEMSVNFHALGQRRGLLVIDCVDNLQQLKDIAGIVGWFGSGSRVIFVTQEKSLLDEISVEHVYELQSLRFDEANSFADLLSTSNTLQLVLNHLLFVLFGWPVSFL
ncbi:hypothetical protein F2Q69_00040432, partial [Brassica cretica]